MIIKCRPRYNEMINYGSSTIQLNRRNVWYADIIHGKSTVAMKHGGTTIELSKSDFVGRFSVTK